MLQSERWAAASALATIGSERTIVERGEQSLMDKSSGQDRGKGATEQNPQNHGEGGNTSMNGQLGHRDEDTELKNADYDLSGVRPDVRCADFPAVSTLGAKPKL